MRNLLSGAICFLIVQLAFATPKTVKVGVYDFPPFVMFENEKTSGLTADTIEILNSIQDEFIFEIFVTSAKRRYADIDKNYDIIFFEDPKWGWQEVNSIAQTVPITKGSEVFVTQKSSKKNQSFFDRLEGKTILGIIGYHYAFLKYSTDFRNGKKFNVRFTPSIQENLKAIANNKADIAPVNLAYLNYYLKQHPDIQNKILISQIKDQDFEQRALVKMGRPIQVDRLNELIVQLKENQRFKSKLKEYQIN